MPVLDPALFVRERNRQRLSQEDLAARSRIPCNRIRDIEDGADATPAEVRAIARALGVKVVDIDRSTT